LRRLLKAKATPVNFLAVVSAEWLSATRSDRHPLVSLGPQEDAKMADTNDATTKFHWVAIDVARYWNAVLIETATGNRHRFKMANSAADFDRLG